MLHIVGAHFKNLLACLTDAPTFLFVTTMHAFAKQLAGVPGKLESAAPVSYLGFPEKQTHQSLAQ